jgi:hypothetical protein
VIAAMVTSAASVTMSTRRRPNSPIMRQSPSEESGPTNTTGRGCGTSFTTGFMNAFRKR